MDLKFLKNHNYFLRKSQYFVHFFRKSPNLYVYFQNCIFRKNVSIFCVFFFRKSQYSKKKCHLAEFQKMANPEKTSNILKFEKKNQNLKQKSNFQDIFYYFFCNSAT